jgi:hypothetical protein
MLNPADEDEDSSNLQIASHGIDAHMKLSLLPSVISYKR